MKYLAFLYPLAVAFAASLVAAPANDNRANAQALTNANLVSAYGTNFQATSEAFERAVPVRYRAAYSVWYKWTAPQTSATQLDVTAYFDCTVALYEKADDGTFTFLAFDDDGGDIGLNSRLNFDATGGKTYYIAVDSYANVIGVFNVIIAQTGAPSDNFASRPKYVGSSFTAIGNSGSFTEETGEPVHGNSSIVSRKTAWITWTAPTRALVTLDTVGSYFDTVVAVYTGDTLDTLHKVAQNDNVSRKVATSSLTFVAKAGDTFQIAVDGNNGGAGLFTLNLKSAALAPGVSPNPKSVTVYSNDPATFGVTTSSTGTTTYQWQRKVAGTNTWITLTDNFGPYSGTTTDTLTVTSAPLEMNKDAFRVMVSDDVATTASAPIPLTVTEFRQIDTEVLGTVNMDISSSIVPLPTEGGVYFATGLPKGLTLDETTGLIQGVVTGKPGVYRITYGSTTGKKKNSEQYILIINVGSFAPLLTGAFEALAITPSSVPTGKFTLKVAANGQYTGTYTPLVDGRAYPFKGLLDLDEENRVAGNPSGVSVILNRGRVLTPLKLDFTLTEPIGNDSLNFTTLAVLVRDNNDDFVGQSLVGAPVGRFTTAAPAPWATIYTARLTAPALIQPAAETVIPVGSGYATAQIAAPSGLLTLRGRLPDNTAFTASLASSPSASYRAAQRVHSTVGGSLAGMINLGLRFGSDLTAQAYSSAATSGSTLYWVKPAVPRDRLYPAGFGSGPLSYSFLMEPWVNPSGRYPTAFGLATTGDMKVNIVAAVTQDSNDALTTQANNYGLPIDVLLGTNGGLGFVSPALNTTKFALKIDAASGSFSGSYELAEPIVPPATKSTLVRKATFFGVMFQAASPFQGDVIGEGFVIVPPFDSSETTTAGLIDFRVGNPSSPF